MGRSVGDIGEIRLRRDVARLAGLVRQTLQERGHVLPVHRPHAAERTIRVPGGDACRSEPQDVFGMRRRAAHIVEPLPIRG